MSESKEETKVKKEVKRDKDGNVTEAEEEVEVEKKED